MPRKTFAIQIIRDEEYIVGLAENILTDCRAREFWVCVDKTGPAEVPDWTRVTYRGSECLYNSQRQIAVPLYLCRLRVVKSALKKRSQAVREIMRPLQPLAMAVA